MGTQRIRQLEHCDPKVFGDLRVTPYQHGMHTRGRVRIKTAMRIDRIALPFGSEDEDADGESDDLDYGLLEKRRCSVLVDQLLLEIYSSHVGYTDYNSATSTKSGKYSWLDRIELSSKVLDELQTMITTLDREIARAGGALVRRLKRRDALRRQRDARCDVISFLLRKSVPEFSPEMRFSLEPLPGDSGFTQWHSAMKMVSQLPEGIPPEFRRQLWLSLADKHLQAKGIDWPSAERTCFSEWSHPTDGELGVQIVKDLHRTGCSLFCGKDGKENQALLKRVLLAYARWNKAVGYCQGFNMLAALILQVTDKSESDALKLMIYLIEGVLPDSYFADSLRGLSVDMAVFRELLRTKLPKLSKHLDTLQMTCKEGTTSYEPPLTNVFTMQWFLTLFCNCLPQPTVLRVWDLILLEGNEILLRTSLAIWHVLADRIMTAKSADDFYCVMGMLMREILEFDLIDANTLVKGIVTIGPLTELSSLREHYLYNINPWGGPPTAPNSNRRTSLTKVYHREKLMLDIGVLKKQYTKLKQRQRQAHVIFNTAVARQTTTRPTPPAMDHLLLGKSALVSARRSGPPKGAVPPPRQQTPKLRHPPRHQIQIQQQPPKTLHWKDARRDSSSSSSSTSSSDTELCDDPQNPHDSAGSDEDLGKCQLPEDNPSSAVVTTVEPDLTSDQRINQNDSDTNSTLMTLCEDKSSDKHIFSGTDRSVVPDLLDFVEPLSTKDICFEPGTLDTLKVIDTDTVDTEASSDIFALGQPTTDEYYLSIDERLKRSDSLPSSEDGFDFEKFLEERVKCMKEKPYSSEESLDTSDTSELDRVRYSRRNSVRALEIIQENSLILHRILQCQSRLTPTPPPYEDLVDEEDFGDDQNIHEKHLGNGTLVEDNDITPTNQPVEDEEGSTTPYFVLSDIVDNAEILNTCEGAGIFNSFSSSSNASALNLNIEHTPPEVAIEIGDKVNLYRPYDNFADFIEQFKNKSKQDLNDGHLEVENISSVKLLTNLSSPVHKSPEDGAADSEMSKHVRHMVLSPILRQVDSVISPINETQEEEEEEEEEDQLNKSSVFSPESNISSFIDSFNNGANHNCQKPEDISLPPTMSIPHNLLQIKTEENEPKTLFTTSYKDYSTLVNKFQEKFPTIEKGNNAITPEVKNYITSDIVHQFDTMCEVKEIQNETENESNSLMILDSCQDRCEQDGGFMDNCIFSNKSIIAEETNETLIVTHESPKIEVKISTIDKSDYLAKLMGKYNITLSPSHTIAHPNPNNKSEKTPESNLATLSPFGTAPESIRENIVEVDYNLEKYRHKLGSPLSETIPELDTMDLLIEAKQDVTKEEETEEDNDLIAIDKNSKYNSILEYSRNLDERFNNMILNSPKMSKLKTERFNLKGNYSLDVPDTRSDATSPLSDDSFRSEPRSSLSYSDLSDITTHASRTLLSTAEIDQSGDSDRGKPLDVDALIESPNLRSPSRIYNPFPVSISSRQSKEVPFRLGLYKK